MIPLSYAQRRLWFLNRIDPLLWYNVPLVLRVSGELDVDALRAALADVLDRHEALRTVFPEADDGQPYQRVLDVGGLDFGGVLEVVADPEFTPVHAERHAFDLTREVPLRAWLFPAEPGEQGTGQLLVLVVHHIASDGWSLAPLARDLALAYAARTEGTNPAWEPLPVQYADYTLWQQDLLGDPDDPDSVFAGQLGYWRDRLAGLPEELALPHDRPRPAEIDHQGGRVPVRVPAGLHAGLLDLAREDGATLFMVLHAALSALLTRLGAGTDIPLGTAVAGRLDEALDQLAGFFVNTLVLRADTSGDPSFRALLARVRDTDLAAYAHQDLPFDSLVEALNPLRSLTRHPLFQTQLTLQNTADWTFQLGDLGVELIEPETVVPRFDLSFLVEEKYAADGAPAGLAGEVVYRCDMFDAETVRGLVDGLVLLLEGAVATPDVPVSELEIGAIETAAIELAARRAAAGAVDSAPGDSAPSGSAPAAAFRPKTAEEEIIARLMADLLGRADLGANDNFFDLGGHSLLAARLQNRIQAVLHRRVPLDVIFKFPTPAELARVLSDSGEHAPLRKADPAQRVPLSYAQRRLWYLARFDELGQRFNTSLLLRLPDGLEVDALRAALADVVGRHEALRTVFPEGDDGQGYQRVLDGTVLDFGGVLEIAAPGFTVLEAEQHAFDLTTDVPVRAWLFPAGDGQPGERGTGRLLVLVVHHIATDGWSMAPLARDLARAYAARTGGGEPDWAPLPVQYGDYTLWQRELLGDEHDPASVYAEQAGYWAGQLAGLPEELALPYDRLRPAELDRQGATVPVRLPAGLHAGLLDLARRDGATLFMVLHAALSALLTRLGAGTDIPLGTVVAGRTDEALDELVGFFVNTLVVRADTSGDPSFRALLARVRDTDLAAYAHQELPFDTVVEALNPPRSRTRHPLFQTVLTLQSEAGASFELPGVAVEQLNTPGGSAGPMEFDLGPVEFDLSFVLTEQYAADGSPAGLAGDVVYRRDMFDAETVQGLVERLALLLDGAAATPDAPVSKLEIMPAAERDTVLREWNDTALPVPPGTLAGLFADQVARTPDDPAVTDAAGPLSYAQLDQRANHLAHRLVAAGAGPDVPVAILADRSAELIVSILGVLKAGSCYLPLPVGAPSTRLAQIIANAGAPILITDRDHDLDVACELRPEPGTADAPPPATARPDNLAYIIYTSGSTGTPKGVAITNQNVVVFVKDAMVTAEEVGGGTWRGLMYAPHSFDASTSEIWQPLVSGGEIVVLAPGPLDLGTLARTIVDEQINVAQFTPTLFALMADYAMDALGHLFMVSVGGERISASCFQRVVDACPDTIVNNGYGPTETTVAATWYMMPSGHRLQGRVPIGRPGSNTAVYLLDRNLRPVPPGVPGELYVGGPRVGRGYVAGPGLTAERFVADPFGPPGQRLYRTGDIARWNRDGTLDFLERSDFQLKIRGNRVEPAEIEVVLESHPGVSRAAVIAREDQSGATYLAAYLLPRSAPVRELREMAARRLPAYMVPSAFVTLDELPLTAHGKLDRKALPEPVLPSSTSEEKPASAAEEVVAGLFADLLGLPAVGRNDSFFDLGGHSLLATQLAKRIGEAFDCDVPVPLLFEAPTVAALTARLLAGAAPTQQSLAVLLPLREGTGERAAGGGTPALFCVHPGEGMSWCYAGLLRYLDASVPVYGIQARGLTGDGKLPASLGEAAADYLRQIRAVQPAGPYFLLGWSYGGVVAQAIATRLQADGQEVRMLALLDSYPAPQIPAQQVSQQEILALAFAGLDVPDSAGLTATDLQAELRQRGSALGELSDQELTDVLRVTENNVRLLLSFEPDLYHGSALLFQAAREGENDERAKRWQPYLAGGVATHLIDSTHFRMTSPEALSDIGPIVAAEILENRELCATALRK
jgi:amino acid adenylation domain-containing protein